MSLYCFSLICISCFSTLELKATLSYWCVIPQSMEFKLIYIWCSEN
ncbi:hypothetical protein KP509_12G071500 [Ceratopteris richardii]|uniref:Uncharacterized protein n=1 Tax=Ceratopteris richardii TaxID=49495 RepID=A0A8T2TTA3_CERRI|nr:hypothetical protein KP509_12G071500 [Ceratopteris richardii]